jgi:hypothetical protein
VRALLLEESQLAINNSRLPVTLKERRKFTISGGVEPLIFLISSSLSALGLLPNYSYIERKQ